MAKALEEFDRLAELLQLEKEEDLEQFKSRIQRLPLTERRDNGYAWYPVQVMKTGYTYGDRAYVTISRETAEDTPHHFRAGMVVNFFTQQAGANKPERSGVVNYVNKNRMQIILNSKDFPDWIGMGLIGVDLLFDDRTYKEMEKALKTVQEAKKGRLPELRNILLGIEPPRFAPVNEPFIHPQLNDSQNRAITQILAAQDVTVVHGPPGTGKTTTLIQAVKRLSEQEHNILVTAPSNTAVDLLVERIAAEGLNVTRIGNISRVDEAVIRHTLEMKLADHPEAKNIKKVKVQAAEARRNAQKYKRRFGPEERAERHQYYQEARELSAWARQLEDRLIEQILDGSQVIAATLVGTSNDILYSRNFRTVFIDEAAQALEPATWIPIARASRVIFMGDPFQLPPTVKSQEAARKGFGVTLIEKLLDRLPEVNLLNVQYRMNEHIMAFSNKVFYNGQLQAAPEVKSHRIDADADHPLIFIDTAGCGFDEKTHPKYKSRYNPEEFLILREHLYQLRDAFHPEALPSVAIISPYREQVVHMERMIEEDPSLENLALTINTIDGFQGQERDVVYISLVRSNAKGEIGFLKDYRRMNVAMTRAKKQLIIVGDSATIGGDRFYADFLTYCEQQGLYQTAWEYMRTAG
ncbi:AAA domain-containing protein [Phaeodactylibacter xiamenensis]|uniref:AAA domain-containing protein n=1 Tax=Phaeodactylibacter xiamenensis TaxID=1524460 RepID=UPI0024A96CAB|nr:AAA domain-containing protein [Phaeodactylibacter xiamenensis]